MGQHNWNLKCPKEKAQKLGGKTSHTHLEMHGIRPSQVSDSEQSHATGHAVWNYPRDVRNVWGLSQPQRRSTWLSNIRASPSWTFLWGRRVGGDSHITPDQYTSPSGT